MHATQTDLPRKPLTGFKRVSRGIKTAARDILTPLIPLLPDLITNSFPSLGRVSTRLPSGRKLRMISDGDDGKDYIARKVAGRGLERFEAETMQVFLALLEHTTTFFDIGANTGIFALAAATSDPSRQAFAFEPVPQIVTRLNANVRLNQLTNLWVEACAVTDHEGELELHVPATTSSIPTSTSAQQGFKAQTRSIHVPAVTLDAFIQHRGIAHVDLMKIDTETTEHLVLTGAANLLERDEPAIICEVLRRGPEPPILNVLHAILSRLGYRYFWITEEGLVETRTPRGDERGWLNNYLFITPKRLGHIRHLIVDEPVKRAA